MTAIVRRVRGSIDVCLLTGLSVAMLTVTYYLLLDKLH